LHGSIQNATATQNEAACTLASKVPEDLQDRVVQDRVNLVQKYLK
jgi:hypothetical protein